MFEQEGYDLIGAALEVYNVVGHGFLEEVYQECMERELALRNIPFVSQPKLSLTYKGTELTKFYRPDLYVNDGIVVELKALSTLTDNESAQLFNYLRGARKHVGYLINFSHPNKLDWKRFII